MTFFDRVGDLFSRISNIGSRKSIQLNLAAERVLKEAEARGYQVTRSKRQGVEAVVLEGGNEASVHLWSNQDIIDYGKGKKWI